MVLSANIAHRRIHCVLTIPLSFDYLKGVKAAYSPLSGEAMCSPQASAQLLRPCYP